MNRRNLLKSLFLAPFSGMFAKKAAPATSVINPAWKTAQYEAFLVRPFVNLYTGEVSTLACILNKPEVFPPNTGETIIRDEKV